MSLLPKSIHRCRRYPTKFNSGRDIPAPIRTVANTDTKLLIYGLFQKGRVLAQDENILSKGVRMNTNLIVTGFLLLTVVNNAFAQQHADIVYKSGKIYTVNYRLP